MYLFIWKAEWATEREAAGELAMAGAWHLQVMIIRDDHIRLPFSSASTAFGPFEEYFFEKKKILKIFIRFHDYWKSITIRVETHSDKIPNKLIFWIR